MIKNDPNNSEAHYTLGIAFDKSGDLERAESEWRGAARLRPDLVDPERSLAGAALQRGDPNTLAEAAGQIIRLQPSSPEGYSLRALSGGPYTKIDSALDPSTNYPDSTVADGQTYCYVTTAVNSNNEESTYSNQAQAVIPAN